MAKEALEQMASQVNTKYVRFNDGHGSTNILGVLLSAEVQPLADGEFALSALIGVYENDADRANYRVGEPNLESEKFKPDLKEFAEEVGKQTGQIDDNTSISGGPKNIADLLENHLDSTGIWSDGSVYKVKHFIVSVGKLEIHVYRDHNPPHFHVKSKQRNIDASFHLETLEPLKGKAGTISQGDAKKIRVFFQDSEMLKMLKEEHAKMQG